LRIDLIISLLRSSPERFPEPKILERTLKCCALNGVAFYMSITFFQSCVVPGIRSLLDLIFSIKANKGEEEDLLAPLPYSSSPDWLWENHLEGALNFVFTALWVAPLLILCR